ncbi:MAG: hypothetical protein Q8K99_03940 [Actinomycetota bacterium]|nr:hypothetical protein [Actinomycetota bacterium]
MEKRNKIALVSAISAALATSALVAGLAFATPNSSSTPSVAPAAESSAVVEAPEAEADGVDHQFDGEEAGNNGDGVPDANEAAEAEGAEESESAETETDGVDHEFDGEEIGDNGNGVPDANEAAETK